MKLYTIYQLSERTGKSKQWITRLIKKGRIKAQRVGNGWILFDIEEAEKVIKENVVGRPKSKTL